MNSRKFFWGITLVVLGLVYLLKQMGFISFFIEWDLIWSLWPIFLIIAGLKLILPRNNRVAGGLFLALVILILGFIIIKGHESSVQGADGNPPFDLKQHLRKYGNPGATPDDSTNKQDPADSADGSENIQGATTSTRQQFKIEASKSVHEASLYMEGAAADFRSDVTHDNLFEAAIRLKKGSYKMERSMQGGAEQIKLISNQTGNLDLNDNNNPNSILIRLNPDADWDLNLNISAGNVKYDFSGYKIKMIKFNSGIASVDLKMGELVPLSTININAGLAAFTIRIPSGSGCRVDFTGNLSNTQLPGFTKKGDHTWENAAYATASKKINLDCSGSLSNIAVKTY